MLEILFFITFLMGLGGMLVILLKKIPVLRTLPEIKIEQEKNNLSSKRHKIIVTSGEKLLMKLLYKIRVLSLKTDNKTHKWLKKLRQKSLKQKTNFSEDYWSKFKNQA